MKKLVVYLLILVCFGGLFSVKTENNPLFSLEKVESVCFVSSEKSDGCDVVCCGDMFFNYCSVEQAKEKIDEIKNADGVQFYLADVDLREVFEILKFEEVSKMQVDDLMVYCGFSVYGNKSVLVEGKRVNVQVVAIDNKVIAGFPMILTGY